MASEPPAMDRSVRLTFPRGPLWIACLLVNLVIMGVAGFALVRSREHYHERAALMAENLSSLLKQNLGADIEKIDSGLLAIGDEVSRERASGGIEGRSLDLFLGRILERTPELQGFRIADATGLVTHAVGEVLTSTVRVDDRDYFQRLRAETGMGPLFSGPLLGRVSGKWALVLARRLDAPGGGFAGIVFASIALDRLARQISSIDVGPHGVVALFNHSLVIVARYPEAGPMGTTVGRSAASPEITALVSAGRRAERYHSRSHLDGVLRLYSFRQVGPYPLYINVGFAEQDYLSGWWQEAARASGWAGLFALASLATTWLVSRRWKERMAALQELARQEERFRRLFHGGNDAVFVHEADPVTGAPGHFIEINDIACQRLGFSRDELLALGPMDLEPQVGPGSGDGPRNLAEQETSVFERVHLTKDRRSIPVEINAQMFQLQDRTLVLSVARDITERKAAEAKISRLTSLYAALSQCNQAIVHCHDEPGLFQVLCRCVVENGFAKMAWIGEVDQASGLIRPTAWFGDDPIRLEPLPRLCTGQDLPTGGPAAITIQGDQPYWCQDFLADFATSAWHATGAQAGWGSLAALPFHRRGHPVGCLTICSGTVAAFDPETKALLLEMVIDIDFALDNFARETEKRHAAEALQASEARFRSLFENAPVGFSLEDFSTVKETLDTLRAAGNADLRCYFSRHPEVVEELAGQVEFLDINRTGRAMSGIGTLAPDRPGGSRYAAPGFLGAFVQSLVDLAAGRISCTQEVELHDNQGRSTTYDVHFAVQTGHEEDLSRVLVTFVDISERKLAEQAQKMESLGLLAGGVAHDMNNVLGAILGLASANLEAQPADSITQKAFSTIIKATERGRRVVRNLLNYARQDPAERRELDLNQLLGEVAELMEHTALSRIHLKLDLAEDLRPILGDAGALSHAFMNLCVNAVDAMPGHGTLTLRTRNRELGLIEVETEDTGCGMNKEVLDRALNPFFTTKKPGKGTGLGLSMVYSTVKAHQGQMVIQSEPGQGTRIRMLFPAAAG